MLSFLKNISLFYFFTINLFAIDVYRPEITADSTGQYVYSVWKKNDGSNFIVQTAHSSDYGVTWVNPTSTTGDGGVPNLSNNGGSAVNPYTRTNATGQYVYAIWQRSDGNYNIIQTVKSSDYGVTWVNPTTTTGDGGSPNLSNNGGNALDSYIATDSTGQYVYAIWRKNGSSEYVVQTAKSSDYGVTWVNPTTTTGDGGSPNLSNSGGRAYAPSIVTDSTGQYVYAIWSRYDGQYQIVQTAKSSDYGVNWVNPTTTTGDGGVPNLSDNGESAFDASMSTNSTGQYVYAVWQRKSGGGCIVQTALSSDYGVNWIDPTTTTGDGGSPNLSNNADNAEASHIDTDSTGQNVYAIWCISDSTNEIVQVAESSDYGVTWINPTIDDPLDVGIIPGPVIDTALTKKYSYGVTFNPRVVSQTATEVILQSGMYLEIYYKEGSLKSILEKEYVNGIFWDTVVGAQSYKVYLGTMSTLVYEGTDLQYFHQNLFVKEPKTYLVTWLDSQSVESDPSQITIE